MHCLALFTAFALVLTSTQAMACQNAACAISDTLALAECNSIGCVRPTNALENLAKTTEHTLSVVRMTEPRTTRGLCGPRDCPTEPTVTALPKTAGGPGARHLSRRLALRHRQGLLKATTAQALMHPPLSPTHLVPCALPPAHGQSDGASAGLSNERVRQPLYAPFPVFAAPFASMLPPRTGVRYLDRLPTFFCCDLTARFLGHRPVSAGMGEPMKRQKCAGCLGEVSTT
jgi:hypothetical protein